MSKRFTKKLVNYLFTFVVGIISSFYITSYCPETSDNAILSYDNMKEKDYVNQNCTGQIEYVLPDKTRIDCLTNEYAIEFDYAKKWAESIGQSLYYSKMTGKKPAVAIILKSPEDRKYLKRIEAVSKDIKIFEIKGYEEIGQN